MSRYILVFIVVISFAGCGTPKFYNEIKSTYESYDSLVSEYGKEAVRKSSFDPHKLVMKKLSSYIQNSNHIIYHYARSTRKWKGNEFSGVVFDVENNKYYYISNKEEEPQKIRIDTIYNNPDDNYYKFILANYQEGRIDYLKKLGELSDHSDYQTSEVICEININSGLKRREIFDDFWFINGKPTNLY